VAQTHKQDNFMRPLIILPTYNECQNLPVLVDKIRAVLPESHVLVVDDNSPDGTGELAQRLAESDPGRMFVLHRPGKAGLGKAYLAGFRWALEREYEAIVQMDADLSHDPAYLAPMLERLQNADLVLGSRYIRGVNVVNWGLKRLLLSKGASIYVRLITRMPFTDATGGFKCWRRETLRRLDLEDVFSNGYLFQVETTYKTYLRGLAIGEVPIIFYERGLGRSKMDWRIIWEAVWGILRLRLSSIGLRPVPKAGWAKTAVGPAEAPEHTAAL
jgi:dolichol-phosphate mannosyltransferase